MVSKGTLTHAHISGQLASHHLHLDPACAADVASRIDAFITANDPALGEDS